MPAYSSFPGSASSRLSTCNQPLVIKPAQKKGLAQMQAATCESWVWYSAKLASCSRTSSDIAELTGEMKLRRV